MENENKKIADKQVKISGDRHAKLREIAFFQDREMREILNEAWDYYVENIVNKQ